MEKDRHNLEARIGDLEQNNSHIQDEINHFRTDIIEDVEQLRTEVNSIKIMTKEEQENKLTQDDVNEILINFKPDYLQDYATNGEINKIKTDLAIFREESERVSEENTLKAEEIKDHLFNNILCNIRNEWDLKFENFNDVIENLQKDFVSQLGEQENIFKDTLTIQSEAIHQSKEEIKELKSYTSNLETKIAEFQNLSNLVDTKHDTGSKSFSNNKEEKGEKDFVIEESPNGGSIKHFKVSPVKLQKEIQDELNEINIEENREDIEDSSVFNLTPKKNNNNLELNHTVSEEEKEENNKEVIPQIESEENSMNEEVLEHNSELETEEKEKIQIIEDIENEGQDICDEKDESDILKNSIQSNHSSKVDLSEKIIEESETSEVEIERRNHDENIQDFEKEPQDIDFIDHQEELETDQENKDEDIKIFKQSFEEEKVEHSEAPFYEKELDDSRDVSNNLINQSIDELRHDPDNQDPNISLHHVVDKISEVILAGETFEAVQEL